MTRTEGAVIARQCASRNRAHRLAAYAAMRRQRRTQAGFARILGVTPRTIQRYEAHLRREGAAT
jgi:DNA-binding transcriptional regulator YiaG